MDFFRFPITIRDIPIERFPLSTRIYNTLKRSEINTYEGLVNTLRTRQSLLNKAQKDSVKEIVTNFHLSVDEDGQPDWTDFCERQGIVILPAKVSIETDAKIFRHFNSIIEEILTFAEKDVRKWTIIQYRFGLNGKKVLTLDELGQAFGKITREAVRLVESKSLVELRQTLLEEDYVGKGYRINPRIVEFVQNIREMVTTEQPDFISEQELIQKLTSTFSLSIEEHLSVLRLLFQVFGMSQIKELPEGVPVIWKIDNSFPEAKLRKSLLKINSLLTTDYMPPMDDIELLSKVNRSMGQTESLSMKDLQRYLRFCDSIETTEDGRYQAKFEKISSRVGQAERLLVEAGEPVDVKELVRQFNQRLTAVGLKKVENLNIANIMSTDKRFVSEASSGRRGLKRWNSSTKTILEQMEDALIRFARPATEIEIFEYVKERRPVSRNSIKMYLSNDNRFVEVEFGKWQLASWQNKGIAIAGTKQEIATIVEQEFEKRGINEMPFPEIVEILANKLNLQILQTRAILRHHPIVKSRRLKNAKTIAILNRNYKAELNKVKTKRNRKETIYQKAETFVKHLLMQDPAKEVELSFLRSKLVSDLGLNKQTAYQCISNMPFIEKVLVAGTTVKICRLKNDHSAIYPKVTDIKLINPGNGIEAERAIAKLNEADVDIGLFMLGRLFENSLKSFLLAAQQTGDYEIEDGNLTKLNNMIQWIKK
ncbi:MAG TPA: DNA-directed RNA polymerase subunit alpha C-terminal domain-containing protein, partial [Pyrinomonadaceae bacterium]|nr:DNA-directed RNA polymerase subunit alpha C-terminal domain-containing protein [Pyrinomonadaceae bacterium]